jgi:hypothetical protein
LLMSVFKKITFPTVFHNFKKRSIHGCYLDIYNNLN